MILRHIQVYFKHLLNNKLSSFINFFGLSLALSASAIIYLYVLYESNYDAQLERNVYRITVEKREQGKLTYESAKSYAGLANLLPEIPAVSSMTRILYEECLFRFKDKKLPDQNVFWADSSFVKIFRLHLLKGAKEDLLTHPNEAMISRSKAFALFGKDWQNRDDILQSTILLNEGLPFKIVAIFDDIPENSHLAFDFLLSFHTLTHILGQEFGEVMPPGASFVYTYLVLNPGANSQQVQEQMNALIKKRFSQNQGVNYIFKLQDVSVIHTDSKLSDELGPNSSKTLLNILEMVAVLIVMIALVNYINLSISLGMKRVREIGMRKVLGATQSQLAFQFSIDSLLSFFLVLLISLLLVGAFLNLSYHYLEIRLPISFYYRPDIGATFVLFIALITMLPSVYMGFTMASIKPFSSGFNVTATFGKVGYFRQALIVTQFVASSFLISSTILIWRQADLMQNYRLGYDKQNVVVLKSPRTMIGNQERENLFQVLKNKLNASPGIISMASGSVIPGKEFLVQSGNVKRMGGKPLDGQSFSVGFVDENFFPTLGITFLAGKTFVTRKESNELVINKKAMKALGFSHAQEAIGKEIDVFSDGSKRRIVGVIEDYHHLSVHRMPTETLFLHGANYEFGYYPIRIESSSIQTTIQEIQKSWNALYPNDPFDYFFLDSFFEKQYTHEIMFKKTFLSFSILALVISCLGLFGLSLYNLKMRQREVCIRTILGASVVGNILLLSKEYLMLVLVAFAISGPLIFYFSTSFLDNFPYHVDQRPAYYLFVGAAMVAISFLTILYNVIKVAGQPPTMVLRNQ
jgi:putative ABC transport system permease protein